jgi:hypothetical protein
MVILAQRLIEWVLQVGDGKGFQRVLPPAEVVDIILNISPDQLQGLKSPGNGRTDPIMQANAMLSLFRTAMDVIDCLQGRRGLIWGQDEEKGRAACVQLWYKIVTYSADWNGVWASDNEWAGQQGVRTLFFRVSFLCDSELCTQGPLHSLTTHIIMCASVPASQEFLFLVSSLCRS